MKAIALYSVFLISIISLLTFARLNAQYSWSIPQSLTDSLADNKNPIIEELLFNGTYSHYIFWERSEDATATSIYCRDFYNTGEPVPLLAGENIHYRNPRFIPFGYYESDTLFYFFYESDQGGNFDIYYQVYTTAGFGDAELLAGTGAEESHFRCNVGGSMVWQEGDKIKFAWLQKSNSTYIISDPVTVDSVNCSDPDVPPADYYSFYPTYVSWLKASDETSSVYYSYYSAGAWQDPVLLSDPGINASPHFAYSACYAGGSLGDVIVWESIIDGTYTIRARDLWEGELNCSFSQQSSFFPSIALYTMPLNYFYATGFMAFVNAEAQNGDVFVNEDGWYIPEDIESYINLSDSPSEETKPAFFNGRCMTYYCDLILIWEAKNNNRQQLYYSINNLMCSGSISETEDSPVIDLTISPNLVRNECDINYTLTEDASVSLQLCTLDGRQIGLVDRVFLQKGSYTHHLNFDKIFPGQNYSGLFMVRLQAGGSSVTQKVIKMQ